MRVPKIPIVKRIGSNHIPDESFMSVMNVLLCVPRVLDWEYMIVTSRGLPMMT